VSFIFTKLEFISKIHTPEPRQSEILLCEITVFFDQTRPSVPLSQTPIRQRLQPDLPPRPGDSHRAESRAILHNTVMFVVARFVRTQ
jgi:hypothetical protein